jgi:MinD superfamily P-loop ATPase
VLTADTGPLVHAELQPAQDNSGKLVARVREVAREIAETNGPELCLVDGPPGIGCPVHAALTGVDLALLVTEPTPSGEHDLGRAVELCHHFQIPARIIINKADIDPETTDRLEAQALADQTPVVGRLPFLAEVPERLARGEGPLAIAALRPILEQVWARIELVLDEGKKRPTSTASD